MHYEVTRSVGVSLFKGLAFAAAILLAAGPPSPLAASTKQKTPEGEEAEGGGEAPLNLNKPLRTSTSALRTRTARQKAAQPATDAPQPEAVPAGPSASGPLGRGKAGRSPASQEASSAAAGAQGAALEGSSEETDPWSNVKDAGQMAIGIEYQKPKPGTRFAFNLVDADLIELVKIIGNITGKSFILGGKAPNIKATIYAPTKITAEEAYQAFLSVLQVNGLTVIPAGRYLKILPIGGSTQQNTPILTGNAPARDQIVTQLYPLQNVAGSDLAPVLDRFKSPDGDVTVYAPTNTLIITDYGTNIRRLLKLVVLLDVPGTGEKIWIEPVNYASADELAQRVTEIFDVAASGSGKSAASTMAPKTTKKGKSSSQSSGGGVVGEAGGDTKISKIMADERTNSLIIVASEHAYLRILEIVKMLDVPIAGEGTLHVHKLQHADATELAKTLSQLSKQAGSSSRDRKGGKSSSATAAPPAAGAEGAAMFEGDMQISADKATNSLVIVSSLRDYISLKSVIDILDTMQRQVFVEAVIMEVSLDKNRDVGLGVHGGNIVGSDGKETLIYGSSQPGSSSNSLTQVVGLAGLSGLAAGVSGPEIEGSQDLIGVSVPAFGVALYALQTNSDVNVLSTPQILATDNVEASIQVGENVPVQQSTNSASSLLNSLGSSSATSSSLAALATYGGLGTSIGRQNVGITLKVTPHINDDNQVRLEIDLEISEVKSIDPTTGPTISKQNAVTTSVVADQQTIVIGGLVTDNEVQTTTKVPVLGDIPILGMLFRHKSTLTKKRNLLIFLTPYIVRNAEDFREIFSRKMAERREFIERYTAFEYHRYDPHLDWSRTNGAISVVDQVVTQAESDEALRLSAAAVTVDGHAPKDPIELPPGAQIIDGGDGGGDEGDISGGAEGQPDSNPPMPFEAVGPGGEQP